MFIVNVKILVKINNNLFSKYQEVPVVSGNAFLPERIEL